MTNGWDEAASTWISGMGTDGDFARRFVLDAPMLERARLSGAKRAIDVGCGEGRFCRMLAACGIGTVGIDPVPAFIAHARGLHPEGDYLIGAAEQLPFGAASFDLVVTYLSLIDIPDIQAAIREMSRVLRPGGHLLVANLCSFYTASEQLGWIKEADGSRRFEIDRYMGERSERVRFGHITVLNWHRPLSTYLSVLLDAGLQLRFFDEPLPKGGDPEKAAVFRRVPPFLIMDWEKAEPPA